MRPADLVAQRARQATGLKRSHNVKRFGKDNVSAGCESSDGDSHGAANVAARNIAARRVVQDGRAHVPLRHAGIGDGSCGALPAHAVPHDADARAEVHQ